MTYGPMCVPFQAAFVCVCMTLVVQYVYMDPCSCAFVYVLMAIENKLNTLMHYLVGKLKAFLLFICKYINFSDSSDIHIHTLKQA